MIPTSQRSTVLVATLLALTMLVLAGCLGHPFGSTDRQPNLNVTNGAETDRTIEVWYGTDPLEDIVLVESSGERETIARSGGLSTSDPGPRHYTSVEFPEEATHYATYELEPGEERHSTIEEAPSDVVVVAVIYDGDQVTSIVSATCGNSRLIYFEVMAAEWGSSNAYNCGR